MTRRQLFHYRRAKALGVKLQPSPENAFVRFKANGLIDSMLVVIDNASTWNPPRTPLHYEE